MQLVNNKFSFIVVGLFIILLSIKLMNKKSLMSSTIIESQDLSLLEKLIDKLDANTLVLFDVKSVLVINQDQILSPHHKEQYNNLRNTIKTKYSDKEADQLLSIILMQFKPILVDQLLPNILSKLRARKVKLLALTSGYSGEYGHIRSREDLRIAKLKEVNIDFSSSLPEVETVQIKGVKDTNKKQIPMYKHGIIFTSKLAKGDVLKAFLKNISFKPNKIILIDNQMKNIYSVEAVCASLYDDHEVEFIGIHYTNILNSKKTELDIERANYQFQILEKELKWLSDNEANEAIKNQ